MKIIYLLIFAFINCQSINIETINLEFNPDDFYTIKNVDSDLQLSYNNKTNLNLMPRNYLNLIKIIFINRKILLNCRTKISFKKGTYETFSCERNSGYKDIDKIKLNFNLNNSTITFKGSELFSKEGQYSNFNFYTNGNIKEVQISKNK